MIDPMTEETFSLSHAASRLPRLREGRPVHVSTIWRWAQRGIRGVRLETAKVGGATVTSAEALRRFFAALSQQTPDTAPAKDDRRQERIERELEGIGIR